MLISSTSVQGAAERVFKDILKNLKIVILVPSFFNMELRLLKNRQLISYLESEKGFVFEKFSVSCLFKRYFHIL